MSAQTVEEFIESLTGFEEIAIARHWDMEWSELAEKKPTAFTRALVFTDLIRQGQNPHEAKNAALGMTLKAIQAYFVTDDEPMPEEPITEPGKDGSQPALLPKS